MGAGIGTGAGAGALFLPWILSFKASPTGRLGGGAIGALGPGRKMLWCNIVLLTGRGGRGTGCSARTGGGAIDDAEGRGAKRGERAEGVTLGMTTRLTIRSAGTCRGATNEGFTGVFVWEAEGIRVCPRDATLGVVAVVITSTLTSMISMVYIEGSVMTYLTPRCSRMLDRLPWCVFRGWELTESLYDYLVSQFSKGVSALQAK